MTILLIQTAFIGDVILATCMIEKLKAYYPDAQIDFLLRKGNEGLLEAHPKLRKLWIWDKKGAKYKELWTLIQAIRAVDYDIVVNAQRFFTMGLLTAFSKGKTKIGFSQNPWSFSFTHRIPHQIAPTNTSKPIHEIDRNCSLLAPISDEVIFKPRLYLQEKHDQKIQTNQAYCCIAPTSVWYTKQVPPKKWMQLINQLTSQYTVYLLGAPNDYAACEAIQKACQQTEKVHTLAGQLSLLESAALMKGAVMNYVNDSAPMHLASAVNAPVTAVFCSTIPRFGFTPLSDQSFIIQTAKNLNCRPCGLHGHKSCPKKHFECGHSIEWGEIVGKV